MYRVHVLLDRTVTKTEVNAPHSFALTFDSGHRLVVFDNSRQYESFHRSPGAYTYDSVTGRESFRRARRPQTDLQMTTARFYDDIATYYDLIFQDWESSMSRQGAAIRPAFSAAILGLEHQPRHHRRRRIGRNRNLLLLLALKGYRVTVRDICRMPSTVCEAKTAHRSLGHAARPSQT